VKGGLDDLFLRGYSSLVVVAGRECAHLGLDWVEGLIHNSLRIRYLLNTAQRTQVVSERANAAVISLQITFSN